MESLLGIAIRIHKREETKMSERAWIGKNKPLTSDKLPDLLEDVAGSEGVSIKVPPSNVRGANRNQIDRINDALARPNISKSASVKNTLLNQKFQLMNGYAGGASGTVGISFEDTQALLLKLQTFQEVIVGDWKTVINQWQNLQNCWQDQQYERFEPFFESLCRTYNDCERQSDAHIHFLEGRIRSCEDVTATFNL